MVGLYELILKKSPEEPGTNFYYEIGFYSKITGLRYAKFYFCLLNI